MNRISPVGLALIRRFESFSAVPYHCPAGLLTIGYGHVIGPREILHSVTEATALQLLERDVRIAALAIDRMIAVPLTPYQFDALVSFTFNVGSAALQRSTLRAVMNRGEFEAVPEQLRRWVWAGGRKLLGLVRRREAEGAVFLGNLDYYYNRPG